MKSFDKLIACLRRFPGVGPKQAERFALYLFRASESETEALVTALRDAKERVRRCAVCLNYAETEICSLCGDPSRDTSLLCIVEEPADVTAIERSRGYRGRYHVLHGALSPINGIGPEVLRIRELLERLRDSDDQTKEIILATDLDTEGEATAIYLSQLLKEFRLRVTRIAQGVPLGGDLDYVDERTLSCALTARREI